MGPRGCCWFTKATMSEAQNGTCFSPACIPLRVHYCWAAAVTNKLDLWRSGMSRYFSCTAQSDLFELPRECSPPGSCVRRISQERILEWVVVKSLSPLGLLTTLWTAAGRIPCPSPSPGLAQTPVHWVRDDIQPSHPLFHLTPSFPASGSFPMERNIRNAMSVINSSVYFQA